MFLSDIFEGPHDINRYHAFILVGAPGSGKTTIGRRLLGHLGFKEINVDKYLEFLAKKNDLDLGNSSSWRDDVVDRAFKMRSTERSNYLAGGLPIMIDGTGRNFSKIIQTKDFLEKEGYIVGVIFVHASLETALTRNQNRERTVDDEFLKKAHHEVHSNAARLRQVFGNYFIEVDNDKTPDLRLASKQIQQFLSSKL